ARAPVVPPKPFIVTASDVPEIEPLVPDDARPVLPPFVAGLTVTLFAVTWPLFAVIPVDDGLRTVPAVIVQAPPFWVTEPPETVQVGPQAAWPVPSANRITRSAGDSRGNRDAMLPPMHALSQRGHERVHEQMSRQPRRAYGELALISVGPGSGEIPRN